MRKPFLYKVSTNSDEPSRDYEVLLIHENEFSQVEFNKMLAACAADATQRVIYWSAGEDCLPDLNYYIDALSEGMQAKFGFKELTPFLECSMVDTPVQLKCAPYAVTACNPEDKYSPLYMLFLRFLSILFKQQY
jgi:hypothetical protein